MNIFRNVHNVLFVCHGNICRSPMAEFVMKEQLRQAGRSDIRVASAALHTDELGLDLEQEADRPRHPASGRTGRRFL